MPDGVIRASGATPSSGEPGAIHGAKLEDVIIDWNGKNLPEELRSLPPGRYQVEPVDPAPALSDEEEEGLRAALSSLRAGKGVSIEEARRRVEDLLRP